MRDAGDSGDVVCDAGRGVAVRERDRLDSRMRRKELVELPRARVVLPTRRISMHDEAIRFGELRPHFAELAVAAHRDLVAGGEEIANRRLEGSASGGVNGKWLARRPEDGPE